MRQRGRTSAAALAVVPLNAARRRLKPPDHLSKKEAALFNEVVESASVDQFAKHDIYLLASFVQVTLLGRETMKDLQADPVDRLGTMKILDQQMKLRALLATKLRITPQARMNAITADRKARQAARSAISLSLSDTD